jgi:hypothetical protein
MAKYRLTKPAHLAEAGAPRPQYYPAGSVVTLDVPPPITAEPLDQEAIDAFASYHGGRRMLPNGLQVTVDGAVRVPLAGGGFSA